VRNHPRNRITEGPISPLAFPRLCSRALPTSCCAHSASYRPGLCSTTTPPPTHPPPTTTRASTCTPWACVFTLPGSKPCASLPALRVAWPYTAWKPSDQSGLVSGLRSLLRSRLGQRLLPAGQRLLLAGQRPVGQRLVTACRMRLARHASCLSHASPSPAHFLRSSCAYEFLKQSSQHMGNLPDGRKPAPFSWHLRSACPPPPPHPAGQTQSCVSRTAYQKRPKQHCQFSLGTGGRSPPFAGRPDIEAKLAKKRINLSQIWNSEIVTSYIYHVLPIRSSHIVQGCAPTDWAVCGCWLLL
jgi:hypothetical protein